jgi:hypothetical protein
MEQNGKKPLNICGKVIIVVDKALQKVEGEHRRGSPHPDEHWRFSPRTIGGQRAGHPLFNTTN